jgi:beta-galactosidase
MPREVHPNTPAFRADGPDVRVRLHPQGLDLGTGDPLPLLVGSMHYWRHPPETWRAGLESIRAMGLRLVDTYVPWGVHEACPHEYDFGELDARLDVARFLELAHELDLRCVLRPGPHINGELTLFGLPEWIVWNDEFQARTPGGHPVILPMVPRAFPVPSYASRAFLDETAHWYRAVGARLSRHRWPGGPIVLVQVDNEGALYFRDGICDQDYHPDALRAFREFLRSKHHDQKGLRTAWHDEKATFESAAPPRRAAVSAEQTLGPFIDWAEFQETLVSSAMQTMADALVEAGLGGLPTTHNLPIAHSATPLDPDRMSGVDLVGIDYYHRATPDEHKVIARRTTELVVRCEDGSRPAFAAEMGAGFPLFFPPLDERDSLYTLMCALAYGLRGFNLYMAVERDRWIGAPIDAGGRPRPMADAYARLLSAIDGLELLKLRRRASVRLVVPRGLRRLARATHAFGPLSPALFHTLGAGWSESVLEHHAMPALVAAEQAVRVFEEVLYARGVPFAFASGETHSEETRWIVCACAGSLAPHVLRQLRAAQHSGVVVTLGPHAPALDEACRPLTVPEDVSGLEVVRSVDPESANALVLRRIADLGLDAWPVTPSNLYISVHEDSSRRARVVFAMNPTGAPAVARVSIPGIGTLVDAMDAVRVAVSGGAFEIPLPARSIRMMAVEG